MQYRSTTIIMSKKRTSGLRSMLQHTVGEATNNLRRRNEEVSYWRERAGWFDDDGSMQDYNNGVYDAYYQIDDDGARFSGGRIGTAGTDSEMAKALLKGLCVLVALGIVYLLYRAVRGRTGSSKKAKKDKKRSDSKTRSKSRSRSRSRGRKSSKNGDYELMSDDDGKSARSKRSTRSKSKSKSRSSSKKRSRSSGASRSGAGGRSTSRSGSRSRPRSRSKSRKEPKEKSTPDKAPEAVLV